MCINAHVPSCARQALAFSIWYVLFGLWVAVLLGHAKVDNVNDIGSFGAWSANEEVVRLDIAVNEVLLVNGLDAR
jgi:hypothetical protein